MSNSARFLSAYNELDAYLRKVVGKPSDGRQVFAKTVRDAAAYSAPVRRHLQDLFEFADLRNAIVHDGFNGQPIAEPSTWATDHFCYIRDQVVSPPTVRHFAGRRPVQGLSPTATIGTALTLMTKQGFSQVPIYREEAGKGQRFVGLLTSNTIARWLGASVQDDLVSLTDTLISTVLLHTEDPDHVDFVASKATMADVLERFRRGQSSGKRLDAIIVTGTGVQHQLPLAILTTEDLAEVTQLLSESAL